MKKILLFSFVLIILPYCLIYIIIKNNEYIYYFNNETTIRVMRKNGIIETIPLEKYIVGVIAGEMPLSFSDEALKAQSVAARTYALKKMIQNKNNSYDVVDTVVNQVYLDDIYLKKIWGDSFNINIERLNKIVLSTEGQVLLYNNEIIDAIYFSTSVGKTENSEEVFGYYVPYLQSVISSWDSISPTYEEYKYVDLNTFYSYLHLDNNGMLITKNIEETSTGRVKRILINNKEYKGSDIVSLFGLRSNHFSISLVNSSILFKTKGYGHGVGMSQYGAEAMSKLGYTYEEILKYYYQNVEISKM